MYRELSEDLMETFKVYTPELLVARGRKVKLVRYGGDVVSWKTPPLFDHIPETVTSVSTFAFSSTTPVTVKTVPL